MFSAAGSANTSGSEPVMSLEAAVGSEVSSAKPSPVKTSPPKSGGATPKKVVKKKGPSPAARRKRPGSGMANEIKEEKVRINKQLLVLYSSYVSHM